MNAPSMVAVVASEPTLVLDYAIYGERRGRWRLGSLFDDRDLALFESQQLARGGYYAAVKVEARGEGTANPAVPTTIFQSGGTTAAEVPPLRRTRAVRHRSGRTKVIALGALALGAGAIALILSVAV